jgi:hypothetical protein
MGYSGRYHAASLAAVFLALAVGILIGVGFGSDIVTGTADDLEQGLETDLDEARAEVDDLQAELERERAFEDAVFPAVVGDRMREDRVALIALGGLKQATADDVEAALGPAGATLEEVAVVRDPPDLDALAGTLEGRRARAVARGDTEALRLYGERAGRALVLGSESFDRLRGTLLSRYSGRAGGIDSVVVVRSRSDDLEPGEEVTSAALEEGLIAGLSDVAITVGAETSDADPSSIGFFDSRGVATVDSVDLVSGRVALVFALTGSASGNFGIKESADSLLPELLAPGAEQDARGRSAGADGG